MNQPVKKDASPEAFREDIMGKIFIKASLGEKETLSGGCHA